MSKKRSVTFLGMFAGMVCLLVCISSNASAQILWSSTATQAYPISALSNATLTGALAPATSLHIVMGLKIRNASLVQPTLRAMLTVGNPMYGKTLTVPQFVTQFGPTTAQVQDVESYLLSAGFTNLEVSENNLVVEATGTATQVEKAFNTSLAQYKLNGATVFLNTKPAQVPTSLAGTVVAVLGLNNIVNLHTDIKKLHKASQTQVDPCTPPLCPLPALGNETYGPQNYQVAYHAASPTTTPGAPKPYCSCSSFTSPQLLSTGKCTNIGIITEGDLTQVVTDLRTYETVYQLPQVPVTIVNAGIPSPDVSGQDEWDLDSQTSTGIAQRVAGLYFYDATSLTDSDVGLAINKAVSSNVVKAFNMSFGECEFYPYIDGAMLLDDEMFGEAALQGMTAFASSADNGSACPVLPTNGIPAAGVPDVSYPASSPYVMAVGGTNMFTNADFTFDFETAWEASGGGISLFETAPFWQNYTGTGTLPIVPTGAAGLRGVPDVAMCAGGSEVAICSANVYVGGVVEEVGGTSLSSPLAMGAWARIETSHNNSLGFASPLVYQLANGAPTLSSPDFNDVVVGTNGLYQATPGYDFVTGLGSWDIYHINQVIPSTYPQ